MFTSEFLEESGTDGGQLETGEMIARIAERMGLVPEIPEKLYTAAKENRLKFGMELMNWGKENPSILKAMPFILTKTIGKEMGSGNLANLWGLLMTSPGSFKKAAERAGFKQGPLIGEDIFQAIIDHPEGLWVGKSDIEDNFSDIAFEDKKVNVLVPEMKGWIEEITPEREKIELTMKDDYPFILFAGRHIPTNANTLMRDPKWNEGLRVCTCTMNPSDAAKYNFKDGQIVRVTTEAESVDVELEITEESQKGTVCIPHGFGLEHNGTVCGVNVNRLTKNTYRDRFAGTPIHRYVPCRVDAL